MNSHLRRKIWQFPRVAVKRVMTGLLKILLLINRPARLVRSGFVLPTTLLLVLMVLLTATALTYRSFTRSDQAITQREQKIIVNAATPAIDRAKAKIEFLFQEDPRFPSGLPSSDVLADLMSPVHSGETFVGYLGNQPVLPGGEPDPVSNQSDPYTLPDETRVDINGDGDLDNAWTYNLDIDGDGVAEADEVVIYSVLVDDATFVTEVPAPARTRDYVTTDVELADPPDQDKADALVTRTGPLATTEATPLCKGALAEGGWQVAGPANNSSLQKNFQVNAFVANRNDANQTFETLEFQQSRIASRANKWGAWFRYDLEIFPGPEFKWNGAMHTDSNLFIRGGLESFMVSSHNSCLYSQEASEITLSQVDVDGSGINPDQIFTDSTGRIRRDFQGQAIKGGITQDNYSNAANPTVHVFNGDNTIPITNRNLNPTNDSVNGGKPSDIAVNPLLLFTRDETEHINPSTWDREAAWDDTTADNFVTRGRIYNDKATKPFVDDFYRADNRWGPKPRYDDDDAVDVTKVSERIGDNITGNPTLTDPNEGLDGYWEREAMNSGLRLIIGERLELGNANGWNSDPTGGVTTGVNDPLYPPTANQSSPAYSGQTALNSSNTRIGGPHEYRQRRSLRDNLAAVQGMVVYHYEINSGQFPAACMALTAHPGTPESIINSRTFNTYPNTGTLRADFLNGTGTNGWEFNFPATFDTAFEFADAIANDQPLGIALRNLARFAGDPDGGAPSFAPVQDTDPAAGDIHPAPYFSMWGDYSGLRRIFEEYLDNSVAYANLSPADKATLHSAACTVSLLAYNLQNDYLEAIDAGASANIGVNFQNIGSQMRNAILAITDYMATGTDRNIRAGVRASDVFALLGRTRTWTDPNINTVIAGSTTCGTSGTDANGFQKACDVGEYFSEYTLSEWEIILDSVTNATAAEIANILTFVDNVNFLTSSIRDRELGFREGLPTVSLDPTTLPGNAVTWDPTTGYTETISFTSDDLEIKTRCNPNLFGGVVAQGGGGKDDVATFGLIACSESDVMKVRHPSLYYLFPVVANHGQRGTGNHAQPDGTVPAAPATPQPAEEYIMDPYVTNTNSLVSYLQVGTNVITGVGEIAAVPKATDLSNWVLPTGTATAGTLTNPDTQPFAIAIGSNIANVPFLDKGMYDGREQLNTRVLDIDIEAITTNAAVSGGDLWLPDNKDNGAEGVVYAFREDAVREDEIVRPRNTSAIGCENVDNSTDPRKFKIENDGFCRMKVLPDATSPVFQDPPLTPERINIKPVDFIADPDRRNHGFRFRTASGNPADFSAGLTRTSGMTFVTDNSVYILGNFNLHSTNNTVGNIVEEFTTTLYNQPIAQFNPANFYTNRAAADLNTATFANLAADHWRPVEILSDSIAILSGTFNDGAVSDTFTQALPGSAGGGTSSYMNQNRPRTATNAVREVSGDTTKPVWIDRNGTFYIDNSGTIQPFYNVYDADNEWTVFDDVGDRENNLQTAQTTHVNATFISGLIPKRPNQNNGGFHNFPRFLEDWDDLDLHIAGSFIQLNFSTTATGQFDQDSWEQGESSNNGNYIAFYRPPNRRWGFDPGLLYVPPAPAARRFVSIGLPRSEYYRELAADDPYILNLRCAEDSNGARVLPGSCPRS